MKILVTGDLHNDFSLVDKIVKKVREEKVDYLFILGDISEFGELKIDLIKKILRYVDPKKVFIVPGNHDSIDILYLLKEKFGVRIFHKDYIMYSDFALVGLGGGDILLFVISENEIEEFLMEISKKVKDKKIILFSHLPPKYSRTSLNISGSKSMYNFIKYVSPEFVIHAHIHETGGLEEILYRTKVLNVARTAFLLELSGSEVKLKRVL